MGSFSLRAFVCEQLASLRLLVRRVSPMASAEAANSSWIVGPKQQRFYTRRWTAKGAAKAKIVFVHG